MSAIAGQPEAARTRETPVAARLAARTGGGLLLGIAAALVVAELVAAYAERGQLLARHPLLDGGGGGDDTD